MSMTGTRLDSCQESRTKEGFCAKKKGSQLALRGQNGVYHLRWKYGCPSLSERQALFQTFMSGFPLSSAAELTICPGLEHKLSASMMMSSLLEQQFRF